MVKLLKKPTLPKKPSKLIRVALADLEKAEKARGVVVDMNEWCEEREDGVCCVCLAGSVMRRWVPAGEGSMYPCDCGPVVEHRLLAINYVQQGSICNFCRMLGIQTPAGIPRQLRVVEYAFDPAKFKKQLHAIADRFEKAGL